MTDTEIGLLDALATVMEVFLASGAHQSDLLRPLEFQRDGHLSAGRIDAAVVLNILIDGVRDPERARQRQILQKFESEPPKGTA
jgi:hypothetical protein